MFVIIILLILACLISVFTFYFLNKPQFGSNAKGERRALIENSPNFRNGRFQNLSPTPALTEGATMLGVLREYAMPKNKGIVPPFLLPARKTNLHQLDPNDDALVWFGHSSYFMQIAGKKILVDPVLCGYASPVRFTTRSFKGSDIYCVEDIPDIDYLFITHDHYDHLDYNTVTALRSRVRKVITGLGVGAHFERWGYKKSQLIEKDWNQDVTLDDDLKVYAMPTRHFSGRKFSRNKTLWLSFVLASPDLRIYIGGDSGYDTHFKKIGDQFGPFDLAILENGQYDKSWKYIHMIPEDVVAAANDLHAKRLLPVHWSKFSLALHPWDDSIKRVLRQAKIHNIPVLHPMIGEVVCLKNPSANIEWWKQMSKQPIPISRVLPE